MNNKHGRIFFAIAASTVLVFLQPVTSNADTEKNDIHQAQAMQFGILFGGLATQYDECARRNLVPAGDRPAEDEATLFLRKSEQFTHDKDGAEYAQRGWDLAKQKIREQPSDYWKNNCQGIAKQWNEFVSMLKLH